MERFRLRVRHEPKRGHIWELHLFPELPYRQAREADSRLLGSSSSPAATRWLRQVATPFLARSEDPAPITADAFGPDAEPRWLQHQDGMRMALAIAAARWLVTPHQRQLFREGLETLPSEVILYWFTLCFYGYRQAAGRAALRTLLTHEEPGDDRSKPAKRGTKGKSTAEPALFSQTATEDVSGAREGLEKYARAYQEAAKHPDQRSSSTS